MTQQYKDQSWRIVCCMAQRVLGHNRCGDERRRRPAASTWRHAQRRPARSEAHRVCADRWSLRRQRLRSGFVH